MHKKYKYAVKAGSIVHFSGKGIVRHPNIKYLNSYTSSH